MPEGIMYNAVKHLRVNLVLVSFLSEQYETYRCHIRAPGFHHLGAINRISQNHSLADVVAL